MYYIRSLINEIYYVNISINLYAYFSFSFNILMHPVTKYSMALRCFS